MAPHHMVIRQGGTCWCDQHAACRADRVSMHVRSRHHHACWRPPIQPQVQQSQQCPLARLLPGRVLIRQPRQVLLPAREHLQRLWHALQEQPREHAQPSCTTQRAAPAQQVPSPA